MPPQPSEENTELHSQGPRFFASISKDFFSRISKKEGNRNVSDDPDATPREKYVIEISATELGMCDIIFTTGRICADSDTGLFQAATPGNGHRDKVALAVVFITEAHLKGSKGPRSCIIEQLEVKTRDPLTRMEVFAATLRQVQILSIKTGAEHLIFLPITNTWSSGLIKHAGFSLCDCATVDKTVTAEFQLCMALPTRLDGSLTSMNKNLGIRAWIDNVAGVEATGSGADSGLPKKIWCTHWITTGNCKYQQVGCKYKHEIPFDEETRLRIGVREIPRWFQESEDWHGWLQQVDPSEREKLVGYGRNNNKFVAWPSVQRPGREVRHVSFARLGEEGHLATRPRDSVETGPYTMQSLYENRHQNTIAPNVGVKTSRTESNADSNADSAKAITTTPSRRPDRGIYRPPGAFGSSGDEAGRLNQQSSNVRGSNVQGNSKGWGRRQRRHEAVANGTHQEHAWKW